MSNNIWRRFWDIMAIDSLKIVAVIMLSGIFFLMLCSPWELMTIQAEKAEYRSTMVLQEMERLNGNLQDLQKLIYENAEERRRECEGYLSGEGFAVFDHINSL